MRKPSFDKSLRNAFAGLWVMLKSERNFRLEFIALLVNVFLIFFFQLSIADSAIIIFCCTIVLSAEILNTAIERICDFIQPDYDDRIGFIKDISAGAVLLCSLATLVIGILVYAKYFNF